MTVEERTEELRAFCDRQGWEMKTWTGTQREPGEGISISSRGSLRPILRSESDDGMMVALARIEAWLQYFATAANDVYLVDPHRWMGRL